MIGWLTQLLILAAITASFHVSYAYNQGFAEAREWHADGADIETVEEMGVDHQQRNWLLGWASRWGWRTYCLEARKRMKFKA